MDSARSAFGWSVFMGALSAGLTYWGTGGDMGYVFWAFVVGFFLTLLVGPSIVGFFGEW